MGWLPLTLYDKSQFNRPEWKALKAPERRQAVRDYLVGKRCFGGLDLSTTTDLTAFTLLFPPQEGLDTWVVLFWAWRPEEGVWRPSSGTMYPTGTGPERAFWSCAPAIWWTSRW